MKRAVVFLSILALMLVYPLGSTKVTNLAHAGGSTPLNSLDASQAAYTLQTVGQKLVASMMPQDVALFVDNGIPYAAYNDSTSTGTRIVVKKFNGLEWVQVAVFWLKDLLDLHGKRLADR